MSSAASNDPAASDSPQERAPGRPPRERLQPVARQGDVYLVASDIVGLKTGIVNLYLLGEPGSKDWVLVDTGVPGSAPRIRELAERRFGVGVAPRAIVLTHAHFDHAGSLEALLAEWDVPVYVGQAELPFVTGAASYAPPDPTVGGGAMAWFSFVYPKHPLDLGSRVRALPAGGEIPELPGWRALATPGHTPGHISLFREEDRALLAGDAFVTLQAESLIANVSLHPVIHRPPAYFTPDWPAARISLQKLAELAPSVVATGHGQPLRGEKMRRDLQLLAYEFERHPHGLPPRGRYREIPALFNESTGTMRLPPVPLKPWLFGLGIVMLVGIGIGKTLRRGCCRG